MFCFEKAFLVVRAAQVLSVFDLQGQSETIPFLPPICIHVRHLFHTSFNSRAQAKGLLQLNFLGWNGLVWKPGEMDLVFLETKNMVQVRTKPDSTLYFRQVAGSYETKHLSNSFYSVIYKLHIHNKILSVISSMLITIIFFLLYLLPNVSNSWLLKHMAE